MNHHNESCAERAADPILTQVFVRVGNNYMLVNAGTSTAEEMIDKALKLGKDGALYPLEYGNEIMVLKPELGEFNIYKITPNPSYELTPVY